MVKGIPISLAGTEYIVPPLSLGALEELQERLADFSGDLSPKSISLVVDATHRALIRNYPDLSRAAVAKMIDLGDMLDVISAVMDISGLKRKALEDAAGEAKAPASR